ncbi:MAG: hypothetical protein JJU02_01630 [Cryomorphaceae bacterium]|nr:hypothetical protein [Cryomorphaceae bacterium]
MKAKTIKSGIEENNADTNAYVRLLLNLWEKTRLISEITYECTSIFPARIDLHYVKMLNKKASIIGYTLASGYEKHKLKPTVSKLTQRIDALITTWKDAYAKGLAPTAEKEIIIHILKEMKAESKRLIQFSEPQMPPSAVEKTIYVPFVNQPMRCH